MRLTDDDVRALLTAVYRLADARAYATDRTIDHVLRAHLAFHPHLVELIYESALSWPSEGLGP